MKIYDFNKMGADLQAAAGGKITDDNSDNLFFSVADLEGEPVKERAWLVDDLIPTRTVTSFYGDGATGKSLLALQLAVAVAADKETRWLNRMPAKGGVLYLGAEDDRDEMHRRFADILRANFLTYQDVSALNIASLADRDALLAITDNKTNTLVPTNLWERVVAKVDAERPALVVLDTLADLFAGNENDRGLARQFISQLRALAIRYDTAVVLLAHPSLTGMAGSGTSGNTAWNNSVRSRLYLERIITDGYEPDHTARKLTVKKSNYGATGEEVQMTWSDGVFIATSTSDGTALDRASINAKSERVYLALLRNRNETGRRVNPSAGANYAPKVFSESEQSEGITKQQFKRAQDRLFDKKSITTVSEYRTNYIVEVA